MLFAASAIPEYSTIAAVEPAFGESRKIGLELRSVEEVDHATAADALQLTTAHTAGISRIAQNWLSEPELDGGPVERQKGFAEGAVRPEVAIRETARSTRLIEVAGDVARAASDLLRDGPVAESPRLQLTGSDGSFGMLLLRDPPAHEASL